MPRRTGIPGASVTLSFPETTLQSWLPQIRAFLERTVSKICLSARSSRHACLEVVVTCRYNVGPLRAENDALLVTASTRRSDSAHPGVVESLDADPELAGEDDADAAVAEESGPVDAVPVDSALVDCALVGAFDDSLAVDLAANDIAAADDDGVDPAAEAGAAGAAEDPVALEGPVALLWPPLRTTATSTTSSNTSGRTRRKIRRRQ